MKKPVTSQKTFTAKQLYSKNKESTQPLKMRYLQHLLLSSDTSTV